MMVKSKQNNEGQEKPHVLRPRMNLYSFFVISTFLPHTIFPKRLIHDKLNHTFKYLYEYLNEKLRYRGLTYFILKLLKIFGPAYSPLNSAKLSCSSEVTLLCKPIGTKEASLSLGQKREMALLKVGFPDKSGTIGT